MTTSSRISNHYQTYIGPRISNNSTCKRSLNVRVSVSCSVNSNQCQIELCDIPLTLIKNIGKRYNYDL